MELVDCDKKDDACNGGLQENAFDWLKKKGFMKNKDYPYHDYAGECKYDESKTYGKVKSWYQISKDEDVIASTLAE